MNTIKIRDVRAIGKITLFGLIAYFTAIISIPMAVSNINGIWTFVIAFVPGLLTIYYIVLVTYESEYEQVVYALSLIVSVMLWLAIRSTGYYSTTIEVIFPVVLFLLIYFGRKRQ